MKDMYVVREYSSFTWLFWHKIFFEQSVTMNISSKIKFMSITLSPNIPTRLINFQREDSIGVVTGGGGGGAEGFTT